MGRTNPASHFRNVTGTGPGEQGQEGIAAGAPRAVNPASWSLPSGGSKMRGSQLAALGHRLERAGWGGGFFSRRERKSRGGSSCLWYQTEKPASATKPFPRGRFTVGAAPGPHLAQQHLPRSRAQPSLTTAPGPFRAHAPPPFPAHPSPALALHSVTAWCSPAFLPRCQPGSELLKGCAQPLELSRRSAVC